MEKANIAFSLEMFYYAEKCREEVMGLRKILRQEMLRQVCRLKVYYWSDPIKGRTDNARKGE